MTTPLPGNSSQTARLMVAPPGFAVGWQETVLVANPVAGADWSYKVDGRYSERLISVRFNFTASAAVLTRFIEFQLLDNNGNIVTEVPAGQGIVASTSVQPSLTTDSQGYATGAEFQVPGFVPDILVPSDWVWRTKTSPIDAADQFTSIVLLVQRFPNDATSITAGE